MYTMVVRLTEGLDLLSLASSPIGRLVPGGGAAGQRGSVGPNSSHFVPGEEDIPFDRSMRYTEVETPMQGGGAEDYQEGGYEMYGDETGEGAIIQFISFSLSTMSLYCIHAILCRRGCTGGG